MFFLSILLCAGSHRVSLCFWADDYLCSSLLRYGLVWVDSFEIFVVYILHVLHSTVLHFFRNDDNCYHTQSQRRCHNGCSILYAMEPLQWSHDSLQGNVVCTKYKYTVFCQFYNQQKHILLIIFVGMYIWSQILYIDWNITVFR